MSRAPSLARHERAGRLEPVRLGLRYRSEASETAQPLWAEARLAAGSQRLGPFDVALALDAADDAARLEAQVTNRGDGPVLLEALVLGFRWADAGSALRFLRHGWQSWSYTAGRALDDAGEPEFPSGPWLRGLHHGVGVSPADRAGWHESDLVSVAEGRGGACLVGLLERGFATGVVYLRRDGDDVRVEVEARCEVPVAPGERIDLEAARVALGDDANRLLEDYAEQLGAEASARTGAPFQAGWCSWYQFFGGVSEADLLRNLEALAAARDDFPIDLVQLDDGYQRAIGDWLTTNERFPRGIAPIAQEIRSAGFRAGIWLAPFCVVPESRVFEEHPDWLLQGDDGPFVGLLHPDWTRHGTVHVLDPTHEEVERHLLRTAAALTGMGFSYLKLDFLYAVAMEARARDARTSRAGRLRRGLAAIREGAGEETFLLGCGCPLGAAVGWVDGMRIGPDVAPSWDVAPGTAIPGIERTQPSVANALRNVLTRAWMHRRLWLNDPDCLMLRRTDTQLSEVEIETLASTIGVSGGMVLFSDDVARLGPDAVRRLQETLALARAVDGGGGHGTVRAEGLVADPSPAGLEARTERAKLSLSVDWTTHRSRLRSSPLHIPLAVFCDFDGTFAVQDVGSTIAKRHAGDRRPALWERLSRGELNAWEYNLELLDGLRLPEEELDAFLRTIDLDPGAERLVGWCEARDVPFRILSDGFDYNLDRLQDLTGVRFAYDANHLRYEDGAWRIEAGRPNPDCSCGTGVCKRACIERFRSSHPEARVVHIGNGRVSDLCGGLAADVVFAKDTLAEELDARGVGYEPFATLEDVMAGLERLAEKLGI
jgi:alpha-galactosidase